MQYSNEILFLVATLILWGLVVASKPLLNRSKFFQPQNYWFLAFAFTAFAFTFFAIASSVNLALLTVANTCIVAGNLYMALFFRFLRKPTTKIPKFLPLLALLLFGLVWESLRQRGAFAERVFLVLSMASLCLIWELIELALLGKVKLKKLRLFFIATFVELVLALTRLSALFFIEFPPGMNLYQESFAIAMLRWSWFAFIVISYVALIGYWIETLGAERELVISENHLIKLGMANKKVEQAEKQFLASLNALAKARDNETGNHIIRTQLYVKNLALRLRKMGYYEGELTDRIIDQLFKAAPLHDIGKVGIPDHILLKPGRLTDEEWEIMKTHTTIGEAVLSSAEIEFKVEDGVIAKALKIAGGHHEKWDGSGYPRGLSGADIPLAARIMSVADIYDALVSERVYKKGWTHREAIQEIISHQGTYFDPQVVEAFIAEQDNFQEIAEQYKDA